MSGARFWPANARRELRRLEGLRDVVVGTSIERFNLVGLGVATINITMAISEC